MDMNISERLGGLTTSCVGGDMAKISGKIVDTLG